MYNAYFSRKQQRIAGYLVYLVDGKETVVTEISKGNPAGNFDDYVCLGKVSSLDDFVTSYHKLKYFNMGFNGSAELGYC